MSRIPPLTKEGGGVPGHRGEGHRVLLTRSTSGGRDGQ